MKRSFNALDQPIKPGLAGIDFLTTTNKTDNDTPVVVAIRPVYAGTGFLPPDIIPRNYPSFSAAQTLDVPFANIVLR